MVIEPADHGLDAPDFGRELRHQQEQFVVRQVCMRIVLFAWIASHRHRHRHTHLKQSHPVMGTATKSESLSVDNPRTLLLQNVISCRWLAVALTHGEGDLGEVATDKS